MVEHILITYCRDFSIKKNLSHLIFNIWPYNSFGEYLFYNLYGTAIGKIYAHPFNHSDGRGIVIESCRTVQFSSSRGWQRLTNTHTLLDLK